MKITRCFRFAMPLLDGDEWKTHSSDARQRGDGTGAAFGFADDDARAPALHKTRDGDAFLEIYSVLVGRGIGFDRTLFNLPGRECDDTSYRFMRTLTPSDLIVSTTRPPLTDKDKEEAPRRQLKSGDTDLERTILRAAGSCLEVCSRSCVRLRPLVAKQLPDAFRDRAHISFHQYSKRTRHPSRAWNGCYLTLATSRHERTHPPKPNHTAVYLLRTPLWKGGPWLLNAWGMSGNLGLIWAYLLRTRHGELLTGDGPLFYVGEMILRDPPARPRSLEFADEWQINRVISTTRFPQVTLKNPVRGSTKARTGARAAYAAQPHA